MIATVEIIIFIGNLFNMAVAKLRLFFCWNQSIFGSDINICDSITFRLGNLKFAVIAAGDWQLATCLLKESDILIFKGLGAGSSHNHASS